jgi:REP element-mobilizing transposase RayT
MQTASGLPIRKRIRLRGFHYNGGCAYYLTIGAFEMRCLFGTCTNGIVTLNNLGELVQDAWLTTELLRPGVFLDEFIVMPNHMHAVVHLPRGENITATLSRDLYRLVGGFKAGVTSAAREMRSDPDLQVWKKRFYDRIVRNDREMERIREYIRANPERWGTTGIRHGAAVPYETAPG